MTSESTNRVATWKRYTFICACRMYWKWLDGENEKSICSTRCTQHRFVHFAEGKTAERKCFELECSFCMHYIKFGYIAMRCHCPLCSLLFRYKCNEHLDVKETIFFRSKYFFHLLNDSMACHCISIHISMGFWTHLKPFFQQWNGSL